MGLRAKIKEDVDDFRRGFKEGISDPEHDEAIKQASKKEGPLVWLVGASRVVLYGFLVALPNVPFLPWGKPAAMWTTIGAGALSCPSLRDKDRLQLTRAIVVFALVLVTIRFDDPTTSIVAVGAFIATAASLAVDFPFVYGITAGIALGGVVVQVFDLNLFKAGELLLSGRPFSPDRGGSESLRVAAFMFLAGLLHFGRIEMKRLESKATEAEEARAQAVADERARIARELHDVVSHHVTAMTLQAEAASMTGDKAALSSVASAGREALTELRRMLGVLRHPSDEPKAIAEPQPGIGELDRLVERTRAGLAVHVDKRGDVRPLPAGVELCVYRLVQEALTNVAKHGDANKVEVVLSFGPDMLTVDIRDNGRPLASPRVRSGGLGLIGMQERVSLLDGELTTGPRSDGPGYQVVARLPIDA